ncbi:MAG: hypothetical protein ACREJ7_08650 [Candidatus Methylomirabilales bacterium]
MVTQKKKLTIKEATSRLADTIEGHLKNLSQAEQDKKISAARAVLAGARAKRRAMRSVRSSSALTPVATRGHG